jgi:tetratricopeptide (TPR) repeat protein
LAAGLHGYLKPSARRFRWVVRNAVAVACVAAALLIITAAAALTLALRDPVAVRESRLAEKALGRGDPAQAVAHLTRAIEADPDRVTAWFERGQARLRWSEGQTDEAAATVEAALADFRQAKKLDEETAGPAREALRQCGRAAYRKGDYVLAEQCYTGAIEMEDTAATVWYDRGRSRLKQAEAATGRETTLRWTEALADFKEADGLQPGEGATLACQAYCMSRARFFDMAVTLYDQAIGAGFPPARLLNNRARCLLLSPQRNNPSDKGGKARADLDAALEQESELRAAYCNRGELIMNQWLVNRRRPLDVTAVADLERAIELGPPNGELYGRAAVAAAAAAAHASLAEWDHRKRQALEYLGQAVAYGQDPQRLARDPVLADLISVEEFTALSGNKGAARTDALERLLWVDPIDD